MTTKRLFYQNKQDLISKSEVTSYETVKTSSNDSGDAYVKYVLLFCFYVFDLNMQLKNRYISYNVVLRI